DETIPEPREPSLAPIATAPLQLRVPRALHRADRESKRTPRALAAIPRRLRRAAAGRPTDPQACDECLRREGGAASCFEWLVPYAVIAPSPPVRPGTGRTWQGHPHSGRER